MNKNKCVLCGHKEDEKTVESYAKDSIFTAYIIKTLSKPFTEMLAYKNGLIDENGNQIKKPVTLLEKNSLTSIDLYLIRIKKLLGNKLDLINHGIYLESILKTSDNISEYQSELELKNELLFLKTRLNECVELCKKLNIPSEKFEKIMLEILCDF